MTWNSLKFISTRPFAVGLTLSLTSIPMMASAQELAPGLATSNETSTGSTDVATEGFQAVSKPETEGSKDASELKLAMGGLFTAGNTRSVAITVASDLRLRRDKNQFTAAIAGNYGRAALDSDSNMETTVENLQGKARYDRFVAGNFALFLSISGRKDRFQGLNLRLSIDPGAAYYFVDAKDEQFWGELGYDLLHDVRRDEFIREAFLADGTFLKKNNTRHSGRAFIGYVNALSQQVSFSTGAEFLQSLSESETWRFNWDGGLSSSIGGNFSVATNLNIKVDNKPLPGVEKTDAITSMNLVYTTK